jgi:Rod binding domain-containing protein
MNIIALANTLASTPKLAPPAGHPTAPASSLELQKLRKAAGEFEAMLLAHWWSAMKQSGFSESDDESDAGHDTLDQLGIQTMSNAVAMGGGLGIGAMLVRGLLSNSQSPMPAPMPGADDN